MLSMNADSTSTDSGSAGRSFPTAFHAGVFLARKLKDASRVSACGRIAAACHERGEPQLIPRLLEEAFEQSRKLSLGDQVRAFDDVAAAAIQCQDPTLARKALGLARLHADECVEKKQQAFAWCSIADHHLELEEAAEAHEALKKALALVPELPAVDRGQVWCDVAGRYGRMGNPAGAAGLISNVVGLLGSLQGCDKANTLDLLAGMYADAGQADDARDCIAQGVDALGSLADFSAVMSRCCLAITCGQELKDAEQARRILEQAERIHGQLEAADQQFLWFMLMRANFLIGQVDHAVELSANGSAEVRFRNLRSLATLFHRELQDLDRAGQYLVAAFEIAQAFQRRAKDRAVRALSQTCLHLHTLTFNESQQAIVQRAVEHLVAEEPPAK